MGNPFKKYYDKGKEYVQRAKAKGKDYGRDVAKVAKKAQPYVAGATTFLTTAFGQPWVGAALGIFDSAIAAPYIGSTAARAEGLSGREARAEGREQREKVAIAAALGYGGGLLTSQVVVPLVQSSSASSAANAAAAAAAAPKSGSLLGPIAQAIAPTAPAGGSSVLGTVTSVLGALSGPASQLLKLPTGTVPQGGGLEDILGGVLGGALGGAPGTAPVTEEPAAATDPVAPPSRVSGWVKVGGGVVALALGGYAISKLRKAA